jgi:uncharacterized protein
MLVSVSSVFIGSFFSWFKNAWLPAVFFLILGYGAALLSGLVEPIGIAAVIGVAVLVWLCDRTLKGVSGATLHILLLVWAGLLSLHLLPGFRNPVILGPISFTPDAIPFTLYFNFDKAAVGFALVLLYRPIFREARFGRSVLFGVLGAILAIALTLPTALWLGAIRWEPKLPDHLWLWMLDNFLIEVLAEEALFRGFFQTSLSRWLGDTRAFAAIPLTAVAFGVAHFGSGLPMILLASLAGVAYGLAYRYGGLLASASAHVGLNLFHILFFTYPLLARTAGQGSQARTPRLATLTDLTKLRLLLAGCHRREFGLIVYPRISDSVRQPQHGTIVIPRRPRTFPTGPESEARSPGSLAALPCRFALAA